jgi:hypothetical protein
VADAPSPAELGPLLGGNNGLDTPPDDASGGAGDDYDAEFDSAAVTAVGTRSKALALKDAITACLRSHGLISSSDDEAAEGDESDSGAQDESSAGAGFPDL